MAHHTVLHEKHSSKGTAPEGFQRAIGKPFGRARRRETSAFGKVIVLSENSIKNLRKVHACGGF